MSPPRPMPLIVAGLVVTALALVLPMAHLGVRPGGLALALLALPTAALLLSLLSPGRPVLTHFAFPLAHLPLLIARPELASAKIYAGPAGLVALLAVIGAGAAFYVAATPRLPASRARIEPLALIGLTLALAPTLALLVPALATGSQPWGSLLALALGPLFAWLFVARGFVQRVVVPWLEPASRVRALYALRERARPRTLSLVLAVSFAALALGLTVVWYLWSPR